MARCSLLELKETREESERESFLLKIFLGQSPRKLLITNYFSRKIRRIIIIPLLRHFEN